MGIIAQLLPEKFLKRATEIIKMCVPKMNGKIIYRFFPYVKIKKACVKRIL